MTGTTATRRCHPTARRWRSSAHRRSDVYAAERARSGCSRVDARAATHDEITLDLDRTRPDVPGHDRVPLAGLGDRRRGAGDRRGPWRSHHLIALDGRRIGRPERGHRAVAVQRDELRRRRRNDRHGAHRPSSTRASCTSATTYARSVGDALASRLLGVGAVHGADHRRIGRDRLLDHATGRLRRGHAVPGAAQRPRRAAHAVRRVLLRRGPDAGRRRFRRRDGQPAWRQRPPRGLGPGDHGDRSTPSVRAPAGVRSTSPTCCRSSTARSTGTRSAIAIGSACSAGRYGGYMATWLAGLRERPVPRVLLGTGGEQPRVGGMVERHRHVLPGRPRHVATSTIPTEYERMSPIRGVRNIDKPMLIIHSEEDWRCPIAQAEELWVALRLLGKDVDFYRFPGENHELSRSDRRSTGSSAPRSSSTGSPTSSPRADRPNHPEICWDLLAERVDLSEFRDVSLRRASRRSACGRSRCRAGSPAARRGGTTGRRRSRSASSTMSPLDVLGAEADHQAVRERPRLARHVLHVADGDADLLAHLAHDGAFEVLARLDEAGEAGVHRAAEVARPGRAAPPGRARARRA